MRANSTGPLFFRRLRNAMRRGLNLAKIVLRFQKHLRKPAMASQATKI